MLLDADGQAVTQCTHLYSSAQIAHQLRDLGAVAAVAGWQDEQDNDRAKKVAKRAHKQVWHARLLTEFRRPKF